jgi:hypothetical protein
VLGFFGIVSLAVAAWDLAFGGFYFTVFGLRLSSFDAYKPFRNGVVCASAALWLHDRALPEDPSWHLAQRWSRPVAAALALLSVAIAIRFGTFVASDSDTFGYVSQAHLLASGHVTARPPLLSLAPQLGRAIAPSGYTLAPAGDAMVPTYAPGYPLVMALALRIGGSSAVYYVVPLFAGLTVWLTYVLGQRIAGARAATAACVMIAFSPIFIYQSLPAMSDVPVTAWWMTAWAAALATGSRSAVGAGIASALAVLTRPNLVPIAGLIALLVGRTPPRLQRVALFACALVPACLLIAVLNTTWYGGPLRSGYGSLSGLYSFSSVTDNLRRYFGWLIDLHSPVVCLALVAPFLVRIKKIAWIAAFCAAMLLSYVFYYVFDHWSFLRFLLPALPFVFIVTAAAMVRLLEALPLAFRGLTLFLVCVGCIAWYINMAQRLGVFSLQQAERRYVLVGEYAGRALPPNAVAITVLHSGSLLMYGNRPTVRWDWLPVGHLDEALDILQVHGYEPYILLEDSEEEEFRTRFGQASVYGRINWPPAVEYVGRPRVRIYATRDRARYLAGQAIVPRTISPS